MGSNSDPVPSLPPPSANDGGLGNPSRSQSSPDLVLRSRTLSSTGSMSMRHRATAPKPARLAPIPAIIASTAKTEPQKLKTEQKMVVNIEEALRAAFSMDKDMASEYEDLEYDSLAAYFVSSEDEVVAVKQELQRLADLVENSDAPLEFSAGHRLGTGNKDGYMALSGLAGLLDRALDICNLDNDGISLVYAPLGLTPDKVRSLISQVRFNSIGIDKLRSMNTTRAMWPSDAQVLEDAAALYDFVSGSLARFLSQMATGEYWLNVLLGALAKFGSKLKFLLADLDQHASTAVQNGESAFATFVETYGEVRKNEENQDSDPHAVYRMFSATLENASGSSRYDYLKRSAYSANEQRARAEFIDTIESVLTSLRSGNRHAGFGPTEYEICAVVMETGFHDFQTVLFQDRDFEFSSTSDLDELNFAHPAFKMLDASISHFIEAHKHNPPPVQSEQYTEPKSTTTATTVEWMYSDSAGNEPGRGGEARRSRPKKSTLELKSMNEITTIMVLLALANPLISARYKSYLDMFYLTDSTRTSGGNVRPRQERSFKAFVRLYTNDFEEARERAAPSDVLKLAEAVNSGLFSRTSLLNTSETNVNSLKRAREFDKINKMMSSWVYTEDAVVVNCGLYVSIVALGASILVAGGLGIGLTLHNRLAGVDPFNITVYAWGFAAFIVIVCKAIKVEEWSWSDFLHGRVKCRSISELRTVTGINEQLIIANLLHHEEESVLRTRGPYNEIFNRKVDSGTSGFSINVPANTKTLLLSGLSMLKVETPLGHALVCLDARRGNGISIVEHRGVAKKNDKLMCQSIDRLAQAGSRAMDRSPQLKLPLKKGKVEWRRVEGVYNVLDAVFV